MLQYYLTIFRIVSQMSISQHQLLQVLSYQSIQIRKHQKMIEQMSQMLKSLVQRLPQAQLTQSRFEQLKKETLNSRIKQSQTELHISSIQSKVQLLQRQLQIYKKEVQLQQKSHSNRFDNQLDRIRNTLARVQNKLSRVSRSRKTVNNSGSQYQQSMQSSQHQNVNRSKGVPKTQTIINQSIAIQKQSNKENFAKNKKDYGKKFQRERSNKLQHNSPNRYINFNYSSFFGQVLRTRLETQHNN